MARNDSLLAKFDKGKNKKGPYILSYIMCRWAIYSLPVKLYHLHLRYSLTELQIRCDQSVEDRTKRIAGETGGRWQNSYQYSLLQIPYQYDSSWPWTLSKTQNIGKWLEPTAWKTVLFETSDVALLVNLPLTEPKDQCRIHKGPLLNCVISQLNSIHNSMLYFCYVIFWISGTFHVHYMPRQFHPHLC